MKTRHPEEKLKDRLFSLGPKRLLAISGDGLRGVVTLGLLAELESRLARRAGRRELRLSDYFDLIGGSGVGAYIAAQLAIGRRVAQVTETLRGLQPAEKPAKGVRFDAAALDARIGQTFEQRSLDAAGARTGLAIVVAPFGAAVRVLTNTPRIEPDAQPAPLIADAVRASVAGARLQDDRASNLPGLGPKFIDPAMAGAGDPSQLLVEAATLAPFGIGWPTGPDQLLIVSAGTASLDLPAPTGAPPFLAEARRRTLVSIQALAHAPAPWPVGGELGDMREARLSPVPMWHFLRLDARVDAANIAALGLDYDAQAITKLADPAPLDEAALARLHEVGIRQARAIFGEDPRRERELLPPRFDPPLFAHRPLGPPRTRLEALGRAFARPSELDED